MKVNPPQMEQTTSSLSGSVIFHTLKVDMYRRRVQLGIVELEELRSSFPLLFTIGLDRSNTIHLQQRDVMCVQIFQW